MLRATNKLANKIKKIKENNLGSVNIWQNK